MEYLWQGSKNLVASRLGLGCDLRLNDRLSINIEGNANLLSKEQRRRRAELRTRIKALEDEMETLALRMMALEGEVNLSLIHI